MGLIGKTSSSACLLVRPRDLGMDHNLGEVDRLKENNQRIASLHLEDVPTSRRWGPTSPIVVASWYIDGLEEVHEVFRPELGT